MLLGFLLEIVQAFTATRVSTVIDFIAQTLGAGAGGFLAIVWMQAGHDPPGQVTGEARYKKALRTLTLLYGLAIVPAGLDHGIYFLVFATFATLCHFSLRFYAIPAVTRELITLCSAMAIATAIEIGHYVAERHVYLMNMLIASLGGIAGSILAAGIEKSFLPAMGPPAQSNDEAAPARVWRLLEIPILYGPDTTARR